MRQKSTKYGLGAFLMCILVMMGAVVFAVEDVYSENLIPVMTQNIMPEGTASASGISGPLFDAWLAFDGGFNEKDNYRDWSVNATSGWLQYEFTSAKIVKKYTIRSTYYGNSAPENWTFEASNDGINWTVLDQNTNVLWNAIEKKEFVFENAKEYKIYRVNISKNGGYRQTQIAELEMMSLESTSIEIEAPQNLIATAKVDAIDLKWDIAEGAKSYNLKRSINSGGPYTQIAQGIANSDYSDLTAGIGITYYYVVSAVNEDITVDSNEASATITPVSTSNSCILLINMTNGNSREFELTGNEADDFNNWYMTKANGSGSEIYVFSRHSSFSNSIGRKVFIPFNNIYDFEIFYMN